MGFSRQEYWTGLSFPSPEDLPYPVVKPRSPALQADSLPSEPQASPNSAEVHWNLERQCRVLTQILQLDCGWAPTPTASRKPSHWQRHIILIIDIMPQPCQTCTYIHTHTHAHTNTCMSETLPNRFEPSAITHVFHPDRHWAPRTGLCPFLLGTYSSWSEYFSRV